MKVAIYHNLPSGGSKRVLFEVVSRLSYQHEFYVFSYSCADHEFCDIRSYVKTYTIFDFRRYPLFKSPFGRINQFIRWLELNKLIGIDKKISEIVDQKDFDFIWVFPCQIQNSPAILRFIEKTPKLYLCQEPLRAVYEEKPFRPYELKGKFYKKVLDYIDPLPKLFYSKLIKNDRMNVSHASRVLTNSNFMNKIIARIYLIDPMTNYGGVDINFFKPSNLPKENFLLSVGSLTPLKGFDFLIRAIALLPEQLRLPLVIACNFENPPERTYLQELANELNVELRLMVGISDQLLKDLYNKATLTLYAPIREPFGLVAIESMACGTPVVGVAEGGLLETIRHQETGLLTPRNEQEFSLAIQTLLSNPQKIDEFGKAGVIDVAQNWSWERSANNFEKHFQFIEKNMVSNKILHMESVN
ncbi:MAG: glycosyltransferase family 4 protein [Anaerolineaceae bacterium]